MLTRRDHLKGGLVLVAAVAIRPGRADALDIGGAFKKVASVLVQGVSYATNPAAQIAIASKSLSHLVQGISPDAASAADMVSKIAAANSTLDARLRIISGVGLSQAFPLFANTGFGLEQVPMSAVQAAKVWTPGNSEEQHLLGNPDGFISQNADFLSDYVQRFPYTAVLSPFNVNPGEVSLNRIAAEAPQGVGYYPSVVNILDIIKMVAVFKALGA